MFALGAFSGTASACCAPVLAGVIALSGAAGSFVTASVVGSAYVLGIVLPLFVIALLWDRFNWGESVLLRGRTFTVTLFGRARRLHSTALISGLLLVAMGVLAAVLAFTGTVMPTSGWQAELTARLQHYGKVVLDRLDAVPGWMVLTTLAAAVGLLAWRAVNQHVEATVAAPPEKPDEPEPPAEAVSTSVAQPVTQGGPPR